MYNMTSFENASNIFEMYQASNSMSDGLITILILIALYVILVITLLRRSPPAESFTAASAIMSIVSLMFLGMDLISVTYVIVFSLLFAVAGVSLYLTNKA